MNQIIYINKDLSNKNQKEFVLCLLSTGEMHEINVTEGVIFNSFIADLGNNSCFIFNELRKNQFFGISNDFKLSPYYKLEID